MLFFAGYTARIVGEIWLRNLIQGENMRRSMRIRRRWARVLLKNVGIRITVEGQPPTTPCLLVANHRSYLDPILMLRDINGWPVAKAELANWPLIGKGAQMAGILYLRREEARHRSQILLKIAEIINEGYPVILFPEGTTGDLPTATLPFKTGAFRLAAKQGIPVVPVAVCYAKAEDCWVGNDTFLGHAGRRFAERFIDVKLCYGAAIQLDDPDQLVAHCQNAIEAELRKNPLN